MRHRTCHGLWLRDEGAVETPERVGPLEMHVMMGEPTAEAAARWAQRTEALAAWLTAEWQEDWISPRRGGRGCPTVSILSADLKKRA